MALYRSPMYQTSFESIGFSVQEKLRIHFQDDAHGSHIGFLIGTILAIYDLKINAILPTKVPVSIGLLVQKFKIDLQDGSHLGFLIKMIFAVFDLQVSLILLTKHQSSK